MTGTSHATLDLVVTGGVARATLTRPEQLNSLTEQVMDDLDDVITGVADDPDVRVLVLTGSGRAFSVGLDLGLLDRAFADLGLFRSVLERLGGLCRSLEELPVPVVAAVNGLARAGGFELVVACDLVVIADDARIGDVHSSFGVVPGGGSTARLHRLIGLQRTRWLLYTARWLTAADAVAMGLAIEAAPAAALDERVTVLCQELLTAPRATLATIKRQLDAALLPSLREAAAVERALFLDHLARSPDAFEGFDAWREGRHPSWRAAAADDRT